MYEITKNTKYNSLEIVFDEKPAEAVRAVLKSLKFRYNSALKKWYGFSEFETLKNALDEVAELETVCKEQPEIKTINENTLYEGWEGGKCREWRSVDELKELLKNDFKKSGLKVSIRKNNAGYLLSLSFTLTINKDDIKSFDEWQDGDEYKGIKAGRWLYYRDENGQLKDIYGDEFFDLDPNASETVALRENINRTAYKLRVEKLDRSAGYDFSDLSDILRSSANAKFETLKSIVASYNHDESNSMIDYFDRDIYDHYYLKIAA